jgi:hypothetical protein
MLEMFTEGMNALEKEQFIKELLNNTAVGADFYTDNVLNNFESSDNPLNKLLTERSFNTCGFNGGTIITITANTDRKIIHVKATVPELRNGKGVTENHNISKGGTISVKGKYKVYAIPENKEIKATFDNGNTVFETGEIIGYSAFMLK